MTAFLTLLFTGVCAYFGWLAFKHTRKIDKGSTQLGSFGIHVLGDDDNGNPGMSSLSGVRLHNDSDHVIRVTSFGYKRVGRLGRTYTICECPLAIASMEEQQVLDGKPEAVEGLDLKVVKLFFIRTERNKIWLTDNDTRKLIEEWSRKPKPYNPLEDEELWNEH